MLSGQIRVPSFQRDLKWTIKDGIAYDAVKLRADVKAMVQKQKTERTKK